MSDKPLRLVLTIVGALLMVGCLGWYCWHPGGPLNKHVWMSDQLPLQSCSLDTSACVSKITPFEIDMNLDNKRVSVRLDVCIKHGELKVMQP